MDERTLAEIEAEMNDPDAWGEPEDAPPPQPRSEPRTARLEAVADAVRAYIPHVEDGEKFGRLVSTLRALDGGS